MRKMLICALIAGLGTAVSAQPATEVVRMTDFRFTPRQIELKSDAPVTLQLRNESAGGHSFSAPQFFAAAHVQRFSSGFIKNGRVEVAPHQTVQVQLVPAAGQYSLRCSHTLHSPFGMKGTIVVR